MSRLFVAASNQYTQVDSVPAGISGYPLTVALWVKLVSNIEMGLFWLGNYPVANQWIAALATNVATGYFYAQSRNTDTTGIAASTTTPASVVGVWTHIAGRFTSATSREIIINGVSETENTVSHLAPTLNRVSFGHFADNTPALPADALIAHPAIWAAALSDAELLMLGTARVSPLLVRPQSCVFYSPYMGRDAADIDVIGGLNLTVTGATASADEPPMLWMPGKRKIFLPAASGFQTAWARNSNQLIGMWQ